jgi:hypothetical protein
MVAGGGDSEIDQESSSACNRSRNEYDTGSVETDNLQSTDQTVSASSLSDAGKDGPAIIDVSKLTTVKVIDKRSSSSKVEYRCEFEPLWLATDLAERAQIGRVHIRSYENGLVRDRRLKTLRVGKRKFSEI